jgi:hypothetical protein
VRRTRGPAYGADPGPPARRLATTTLAAFDDALRHLAREHALPPLEPRLVCTDPAGDAKIARAVVRAVARASAG